jgi:transposase
VIPWAPESGRGASCGSRSIEWLQTVAAFDTRAILTDAEWALVAPLIRPAKRGGRPRTVDVREVLNAIFYVLWTGCQWKALPRDLPPRSTVWEYLDLWDWDGTLGRIHHALYVEVRERAGREASPTTAIIDSQTAKGSLKGGLRSTRPGTTQARRWLAASVTS